MHKIFPLKINATVLGKRMVNFFVTNEEDYM